MELGFYTFGDLVKNPSTRKAVSAQERMQQMLELATIADQAGLDILGVGEHHGLGFVNSATGTILSAMAARTRNIRLTSATTLISTADPVRIFQEFATADLVSNGRVELIFGRGAFLDNFPLFGFDTQDYDALFVEKIALFKQLNENSIVSWQGRFRPALVKAEIAPRPAQGKLPVWIGAGSPGSVARAATLGYPVAIPMLGGAMPGYVQTARTYHEAWEKAGHPKDGRKLAVFAHLHVAENSSTLESSFYPYYSAYLEPLFKQKMPMEYFRQFASPEGSLVAGGAQAVIDKIMVMKEKMGATRYVGQIDIGGQPFSEVAKSVELFCSKVAPVLKAG